MAPSAAISQILTVTAGPAEQPEPGSIMISPHISHDSAPISPHLHYLYLYYLYLKAPRFDLHRPHPTSLRIFIIANSQS
jgi:hypothetical protein